MNRRPPSSTRTDTLVADTTLCRSIEDHCPARCKDVGRKNIRQVLDDQGHEKPTFVRTTTVDDPGFLDDLEAIVSKNLYGVMLPKVRNDDEIGRASCRERVCQYV